MKESRREAVALDRQSLIAPQKAKDWMFHLIDEDVPAGYAMTMEQADSLLAEWTIRAWKKKDVVQVRTL